MADVGYKNNNNIDIYSITSQVAPLGHDLTYFNSLFFYRTAGSTNSKSNIKAVSYNSYNCHEEPYYFGSGHGYYFGASRTNAALATKESLLRLKCSSNGSVGQNDSDYRAISGTDTDYYIFYRDGKFTIYRSFNIIGTTVYPNDNDIVWSFDTKYSSERVVIVLTGGGGGGGAPYSGHDGAGGGGAGTVIATLNLSKVRKNTNSWYHFKLGAGGSKSSGG